MSQDEVDRVLQDFALFINDANVTRSFASAGLRQLALRLAASPVIPENPDPPIFVGAGDPNEPNTVFYGQWRRSEALDQLAMNGPIDVRLDQQWIVHVYTGWEHSFRARLAAAHGCETGTLQFPLLGDLRLLRHDIVHNHGIASSDNAGRCEVLQWFAEGDVIHLPPARFAELLRLFPWDAMGAGPS